VDPIQELKDKRAKLLEEMGSISKAAKLGGRSFTDAERDRLKVLGEQDDQLKAEIEWLEADKSQHDRIAKSIADASKLVTPQSGHGASAPLAAETVPAESKAKPFRSLGEQLQAIANATMNGRDDRRLRWESLAPATGGAVSNVPADGGYLIEKDFVSDLTRRMYDMGQLLQRVRRIGISANSDGLKLNLINETSRATGSRWGGVQVYWGAEADEATAKKPKLRQAELELKDLIGLAYATNRLLADAGAMEAVFMAAFSEEMSFALEDAIINGTGAGQPLGILNAGCVVSVAKESGQPATTLVYENINKMWSRMWSRSRQNAIWIINQDVETQLHSMALPVGTGGVPVYMPAGGLSESPFGQLFGRPVLPLEYCATLGTTGDVMLIDPTQYLMIDKGGVQADQSVHVRFTTNENTFRWIYRADGQPLWNSTLTPYKGSGNTVSPFVKLDTRA